MSMCSAISSCTAERSPLSSMEHLVEVVHPLGVGAQQPGFDEQFVAEMDFPLVERVGFGGEAGIAGRLAVGVADIRALV